MAYLDTNGLKHYHETAIENYTDATAILNKDLTWAEIADDMYYGRNYKYKIGDLFLEPWTDTAANTSYDQYWRLNHFETCELENGDEVPGMWLECMYAHPFGVQFSHQRAILRCPNGLMAGSYYFTFETNRGTYVKAGDIVAFIISENVPEGGRIAGCYNAPDQAKSNWRIYVYGADGKTILETITPTFTATGTSLGTVKDAVRNGDLNSCQEISYGWNNWEGSALRQYLNSDDGVGLWWTTFDGWDIAPNELSTKAGFLSGLPASMIAVMKPAKTKTYANTVNDGGGALVTYDKVTLMSLNQLCVNPQVADEGEQHEYYKQLKGSLNKYGTGTSNIYREFMTRDISNHRTRQTVRLRSAYRGNACYTWYLISTGFAYSGNASSSYRFRPLVFIGK